MATETVDETAVDQETESTEESPSLPAGKFSLGSKRVKIAGLLVLFMVLQGTAFYFLVPPPANTTNPDDADGKTGDQDEGTVDLASMTEVPVGDSFNCTNSVADPGSIVHVTFKLIAIVSKDQRQNFVEAANTNHKHRVRQEIVKVARSSSLEDLKDPNLGTMKRLIREEINKVLGTSYVNKVVISEFRIMLQ